MEEKKASLNIRQLWLDRNISGTAAARLWEIFKFCVAGGVGFLIEFGLFHLLANVLDIHYLIANAISFIISVGVNYLLCTYWVFAGANRQSKMAMLAFLATSLIGLGLNELIMLLLVGALGMDTDMLKMAAKVITAVLVMIWNYFSKRMVLTYRKKPAQPEEDAANNDIKPD